MSAPLDKPVGVFQLRADQTLLQEVKAVAARRRVSANRLLVEVIQAGLKADREREQAREWREGFEAMGRDPDTNTVEYALPAAQEVLFGG